MKERSNERPRTVSDENAKQQKQDHRIISLILSFYPDEAEKAKRRSVVNLTPVLFLYLVLILKKSYEMSFPI